VLKYRHKYLKILIACQWKASCFFSNSAAHYWPSEERTSFPTTYTHTHTHTPMLTLNHCCIVYDLRSYIDLYFITSLVTGTAVYPKCTHSAVFVLVPGNDCVLLHQSFCGCSSCLLAALFSPPPSICVGNPELSCWIAVICFVSMLIRISLKLVSSSLDLTWNTSCTCSPLFHTYCNVTCIMNERLNEWMRILQDTLFSLWVTCKTVQRVHIDLACCSPIWCFKHDEFKVTPLI